MYKRYINIILRRKLKIMLGRSALLFALVLLLVSCEKTIEVELENSYERAIKLKVNDEAYEVEPKEYKLLELKKGDDQIVQFFDGDDILFKDTLSFDQNGILNPLKNKYVVWSTLYLLDTSRYEELAEKHLDLKDTVVIDEIIYRDIDLKIFDNDFIPKTWDYNLAENWPDEVEIPREEYLVLSKIYSLKKFLELE